MARLTQKQVEDWITQNGGPASVQYSSEQRQIRNPSADITEQTLNPYVSIEVEVWRNGKTGAELSVRRGTDGDFEQIENKGADPNKPTAGATPARTPERAAGDKADEDQRSWNEANGPGKPGTSPEDRGRGSGFRETHLERRDREAKEKKEADAAAERNKPATVATNTTEPFIVQTGPNGTLITSKNPNYQGPKLERSTVKGEDGRTYIVTVGADGKPTAAPVEGLPSAGPNTPRTPGPEMPQIVLGQSQQALRTYKADLQKGVAAGQWSQSWADARWGEALQLAQTAVQEAATQQRDIESTRNAQYNLATARNTSSQNAMTMALDYVNKINGLLPEGSNLGGQTFAAILGLNMLNEARSGLGSLDLSGRPAQPVPPITPAALANVQTMAAERAAIQAQIQEHTAQQAAASAPAAPTNAQPVTAASATPGAPVAPATQGVTRSASTLPAVGRSTKPMYRVDLGDETVYYEASRHPEMASSPNVTLVDAPTDRPEGFREPKAGGVTAQPNVAAPFTPLSGERIRPDPNAAPQPSTYGGGGDVSQAPMSPYPVLAKYSQPAVEAPPMPSPTASQASYPVLAQYGPAAAPQQPTPEQPSMYPAAMRSRAQATEPWRMSPDEIQQMLDAGIPEDEIWAVPGRAA